MKILAIDTSTEACSAALFVDGQVDSRFQIAPRDHSQLLLPMMDSLLSGAGLTLHQLDGLAFGRGPGGFTGIRIGTGIVQGTALGSGLPVVPVSSLAALAHAAWREQGARRVLAGLDARMQEVYWAAYEVDPHEGVQLLGAELVVPPDQVPVPDGSGWVGIGSGWDSYAAVLESRCEGRLERWIPAQYPSAVDVAMLGAAAFGRGEAVAAEEALPVYLRDSVAVPAARAREE